MSKDIEKDYWKYYVRLPYESPVYKVVEDKKEALYTFGEAVKMMQTGVEMSVKADFNPETFY